MKKVLRSVQTLFPFLHDAWFSLKFLRTKAFKVPHEDDFNAMKLFNPASEELFVDIGSNRGEAILSMLISADSNNKIVGFEPNPLIFDKLKKYFENNSRVLVHNIGLADVDEEHDLFIPFYRKWMFDGLSSFKYEEANDWLKTRLWGFDEKKFSIKSVNCVLKKLDDSCNRS